MEARNEMTLSSVLIRACIAIILLGFDRESATLQTRQATDQIKLSIPAGRSPAEFVAAVLKHAPLYLHLKDSMHQAKAKNAPYPLPSNSTSKNLRRSLSDRELAQLQMDQLRAAAGVTQQVQDQLRGEIPTGCPDLIDVSLNAASSNQLNRASIISIVSAEVTIKKGKLWGNELSQKTADDEPPQLLNTVGRDGVKPVVSAIQFVSRLQHYHMLIERQNPVDVREPVGV